MQTLAPYIDHTLLKANAGIEEITKLCREAAQYSFKAVCVNPYWVRTASKLLAGTEVLVATVTGFPLGATFPTAKAAETHDAVLAGANEIDMVMNIGAFISGDIEAVKTDIIAVREASGEADLKVILETCLLADEEITIAAELAAECGADFIKTSTGFSDDGASVGVVKLIRRAVGSDVGIKASGGIRTREQVLAMIEAGADRIGTSAGIAICEATDS